MHKALMMYVHVKNHCRNITCQNFKLMFSHNSKGSIKRKISNQSMRETAVTNLHHTCKALCTDQDSTLCPLHKSYQKVVVLPESPISETWGRRDRDVKDTVPCTEDKRETEPQLGPISNFLLCGFLAVKS